MSQSLLRALSSKRPSAGVLHHSDRGSQYCSQEYRSLLERFGLQNLHEQDRQIVFDNAPMESFWGTLKQETGFTTATTGADERQFVTSRNTSRASTIASAGRLG